MATLQIAEIVITIIMLLYAALLIFFIFAKRWKALGWSLQAPVCLLLVGSFGGSIYAVKAKIAEITYSASILLGVVLLAYIIGIWLVARKYEIRQA